jgi:hypothetical protein
MSWFPERCGWTSHEVPTDLSPNDALGVEVARGVVIERRRVLWAGAAALLGATAKAEEPMPTDTKPSKPAVTVPPALHGFEKLDFEELVQTARPLSGRLIETPKPNEDAYLYQLASLYARLDSSASKGRRGCENSTFLIPPPSVGPPAKPSKYANQAQAFSKRAEPRPSVVYATTFMRLSPVQTGHACSTFSSSSTPQGDRLK